MNSPICCDIILTERAGELLPMVEVMTKEEAKAIKEIIRDDLIKVDHYRVYYQSIKEELRVRVYTYYPGHYNAIEEQKRITKLLNKISCAGYRPRYKIDHKIYQGFILDTFVVFY